MCVTKAHARVAIIFGWKIECFIGVVNQKHTPRGQISCLALVVYKACNMTQKEFETLFVYALSQQFQFCYFQNYLWHSRQLQNLQLIIKNLFSFSFLRNETWNYRSKILHQNLTELKIKHTNWTKYCYWWLAKFVLGLVENRVFHFVTTIELSNYASHPQLHSVLSLRHSKNSVIC
jgi:hypothetical protein